MQRLSIQSLGDTPYRLDGVAELWGIRLGSVGHRGDEASVFVGVFGIGRNNVQSRRNPCRRRPFAAVGPRPFSCGIRIQSASRQLGKAGMIGSVRFKRRQIVQMTDQRGIVIRAAPLPGQHPPGQSAEFVGRGLRRRDTGGQWNFLRLLARCSHKGAQGRSSGGNAGRNSDISSLISGRRAEAGSKFVGYPIRHWKKRPSLRTRMSLSWSVRPPPARSVSITALR